MSDSKSAGSTEGHEVVLRQRYNDPMKLKKVLDEMFGEGKYRVQTRSTRWILRVPEPMPKVNASNLISVSDTKISRSFRKNWPKSRRRSARIIMAKTFQEGQETGAVVWAGAYGLSYYR
ncbi:hypothetical protein F4806DRAFT_224186 [Annulohypoxylon nitens]|nr:hypothetical protein F4806DRAFT_224186 [Annulohypoxylon nitens]